MLKSTIKKLYAIAPLKKEVFTFIKFFGKPKPNVYQHLHFKGPFKIKIKDDQSFKMFHYGYKIENELFWAGIENGWEKISTDLWIKLCEGSNCIFDVGANTGIYALLAKAVNSNAKVYAFEPVERVYQKLEKNIILNNFNIDSRKVALSNRNGNAIIYDIPNTEHIYSVTVNKNMFSPGTPVIETTIQTQTLDSIISEDKIDRIDLIKIDVESHEPEVLEGYMSNLKKHLPTMLIEVLTDEVGQKIESYIKELPYLYYNIDENSGLKQVGKIVKSDFYNYLLCTREVAMKLGITVSNP